MTQTCSKCGTPLALDAPPGVCPNCALRAALNSQSEDPADESGDGPPKDRQASAEAPRLDATDARVQRFGDYELLEEIARGGMGIVYRARQISLDRIVAVKLLPFSTLTSAEFIKRFRAEASAAAALRHSNIVTVHEVGVHQGQHYLVMNFVNGPPLGRLVADGPLPARRAATYLKVIAEAVHYAHEQGILHRDLKPSNVLIDENDQPEITDFGLAKRLDGESSLTLTGQALGSPGYMPPEQASAEHSKVTRRSDVYGLGAMLYHLLTGRPPFQASTLNQAIQQVVDQEPIAPGLLNPNVPRDLQTICLKCLEKEPEQRYSSAQEMANELGRFLNGEPIRARPVSLFGRTWRWGRRRPVLAGLIVALLITLVSGIAGVLWQWCRAVAAEHQALRDRDRAVTAEQQATQERNQAELLAAEAALEKGQSKLEAGNNLGLFDLVEAYRFAEHHPAFRVTVGHRWSLWHEEWARRTMAVRPRWGTPSPDYLEFATLTDWPPENNSPVIEILDMLTGARIAGPLMHDSAAKGGAFSPDGRHLATITENGVIHLWDSRTGKPLRPPCETGIPELNKLLFSASGRFLVAFSLPSTGLPLSPTAALVRLDDPQGPAQLLEHRYTVGDARFSSDGDVLAIICTPEVQLWRTEDVQPMGPPIAVSFSGLLEFNHDGTQLAISPPNSRGVRLLDPGTRRVIQEFPVTGSQNAAAVGFSHDGNLLATCNWDGTFLLWRTNSTSEPYATHQFRERMRGRFSFNREDSLLAVGDAAGTVRVINSKDGRVTHELRTQPIAAVQFLTNGVLAATALGQAAWWDLNATPLRTSILPQDALASAMAFDGSGKLLAVGGAGELRLWRMQESPRLERRISMPGRVMSLVFCEAEDQFVAFTDDGSLTGIDPRTGLTSLIRRIERGYEMTACLSPDAHKLALFRYNEALMVDAQTEAFHWLSRQGGFLSVAFRRDSQRMAVGVASWRVCFYDSSGKDAPVLGELSDLGGWVHGVAYHPDGQLLAVNVERKVIRLIDPDSNRPLFSGYEPSLATVELLRFSPDGSLLATAGRMQEGGYGIELWHVDPQRGLSRGCSVLPCDQPIWSLEFSPDSRTLAAGGLGSTRLWHLPATPTSLEEMESQTWTTVGFQMDENEKPVLVQRPIENIEEVRSRLTHEPTPSATPLELALKLPPAEALVALKGLTDQNPGEKVYRELRGYLHANLVVTNALQGQWNEALAHANEAIRLGCDDPYTQAQAALLSLAVGDQSAYRTRCRKMVAQYQSSSDPAVIKWLVTATALQPGAFEDYAEIVKKVRAASRLVGGPHAPAYRFYLGAALARAGQYAEAVTELEQVKHHLRSVGAYVDVDPVNVSFLLAICHAHLGHQEKAREWFNDARADAQNFSQTNQPYTVQNWMRRPILELLQQEAEAALGPLSPQQGRTE